VLDAYAGSGALGIEALSRGAEHVTFAETDAAARAVVAANLAHTGFEAEATVVGADGARAAAQGPWDLVLLDPPYAHDAWPDLLAAAAAGLSADGVVVVESDREVQLGAALDGIRVRQYGGTVVTFATRTGASS
jgi:16S rRNA (guanine966-N2)-methyltransferase